MFEIEYDQARKLNFEPLIDLLKLFMKTDDLVKHLHIFILHSGGYKIVLVLITIGEHFVPCVVVHIFKFK